MDEPTLTPERLREIERIVLAQGYPRVTLLVEMLARMAHQEIRDMTEDAMADLSGRRIPVVWMGMFAVVNKRSLIYDGHAYA